MPVVDTQALIQNRVHAIRRYHDEVGVMRAQIDVSGGLDSAVIVGLLARALGPEHITAVHSQIHSNPEHLERAQAVCDVFGVTLTTVDLTDVYEALVGRMQQALGDPELTERLQRDPTILGSIRSTLRAPVGRGFNRMAGGGIRHGTGNECEDRWARFYQKGGDGEVDTNPIAMLSKGEVFQLARALGVPDAILTATPSPDLWGTGDQHNDEDEFAAYFGFAAADHGHTFYSYIDPATGQYVRVGLIERVSRWLDERGDVFPVTVDVADEELAQSPAFHGVADTVARKMLAAAQRAEQRTRHKFNPNCPSLGSRDDLVRAAIVTNALP